MIDDVTRCPDPDALVVLLYDDEGDASERAALQAHLEGCGGCAGTLTSFRAVKATLGAWLPPPLPLGFAVVRNPPMPWRRRVLWTGGLSAAAALVLAAAASLAQLQITWDATGLTLRTGMAGQATMASAAPAPAAAAATSSGSRATSAPASPAGSGAAPAAAMAAQPPAWRADLDLLATQLRGEFARVAAQPPRPTFAAAVAAERDRTEQQLLARVAALLDQSEVRQQQNLALRVTELGRQFEIQRQADIVQVEQTLNRIEQQRRDLLRRVSSTQPRP